MPKKPTDLDTILNFLKEQAEENHRRYEEQCKINKMLLQKLTKLEPSNEKARLTKKCYELYIECLGLIESRIRELQENWVESNEVEDRINRLETRHTALSHKYSDLVMMRASIKEFKVFYASLKKLVAIYKKESELQIVKTPEDVSPILTIKDS